MTHTGGEILAYSASVPSTPEIWNSTPNSGRFGYSILDESGTPNTTGSSLWSGKSTGDYFYNGGASSVMLLNRPNQTDMSGASTTLTFKVQITPNPSPTITADYYTATTTITAVMN